MRSFTLDEVIDSVLKANANPSPAYKAHATRRLKAYTLQRCAETNAKPSRIMAGVRAAVSKRKNLAEANKRKLIEAAATGVHRGAL